jgi:NAD(P)H-hydrate repair Nnr-like enzyme with NAD(P)H-hydrate dehydratase domain
VQAVALADPIVAAGGSAPVATAPDELASIRQEIEQRMAGTGFGDVLDGIFAPPATFDAPQTTDGVWT